MSKLVFAINAIHHNPTGKKTEVVEPSTVFECHDSDYASFIALGAVRDPSDAEVTLHKMANGAKLVEPETAKPEGKRAGKGEGKSKTDGAETTSGSETETGTNGEESTSGGAGTDNLVG